MIWQRAAYILDPAFDALPRLSDGDVVDHQHPARPSVVRSRDGAEALLPRSVPHCMHHPNTTIACEHKTTRDYVRSGTIRSEEERERGGGPPCSFNRRPPNSIVLMPNSTPMVWLHWEGKDWWMNRVWIAVLPTPVVGNPSQQECQHTARHCLVACCRY
jgi:hypothetical protein